MLGLGGVRNKTSFKSLKAGLFIVAVFLSVVFPLKLTVCQDISGDLHVQLSVSAACCQDACCDSNLMVSALNAEATQTAFVSRHCQDTVYFVASNARLESSFSSQYKSLGAPVAYPKTTSVYSAQCQRLNSASRQLGPHLSLPPPYLTIRETTVLLV